MCVSHAQISYFHRPYVMERMQNGGSGSTVFGRAFMPCVEEISSQLYKVGGVRRVRAGRARPGRAGRGRAQSGGTREAAQRAC